MEKPDFKGKGIKQNQLNDWDSLRFKEWFALIHFFSPKGEWEWTDVGIKSFLRMSQERPVWREWVDRFQINEKDRPIVAGNRIMSINRVIGMYLQNNPHVITPDMRNIMLANPKLAKYAEPFTVKKTNMGAEVIVPNTDEGSSLTLPEVNYHKGLLKMAAIFNDLTTGITKEDIRKMAPSDRIELALKIARMMSNVAGGQKPNIAVFKQLVINNAGKDDLEKAMLAYTEEN